ncbi:asparaginase [Fusarium tjaetaba]|uniref:Asparaginase n=1 Tax=Fusarium tjaetaba TaxID=1567544 RepID=A0A8H5S6P2_9HYPO|nr:asparaginase [Fusarium tjaetaba]KAF5647034.1 asparaginase [Fusarium tjaetaba]
MTQTKYVENNCVITDRDGIVENIHRVHVAVTDSNGNILYSVGSPARVTLARSAVKPAQALAVIETGGFDEAGFDEIDLALMCASHNAEPRHVERARGMLIKAKAQESDYRCGGHASLNHAVNQDWAQKGLDVTGGVYNNCSGKHAGMMAGALALGASIANYHCPDHPMQVQVKRVVKELCPDPSLVQWATDGCNLPSPAFPLFYLALICAVFAAGADSTEQEGSSARTRNLARIFNAMSSYPEYVAGEGRFCTDLMQVYKGQLIGKVGADGCYGVGIRESEQTRSVGARGPLGISVKVDDGNLDILYAVVVEVLEQLHIGTTDTREALEKWHHFKRRNTMGIFIGSVSFDFKLRSAA